MMSIQDKNEVICQVLYESIKSNNYAIKLITEFGYFQYILTPEFGEEDIKSVQMGFASSCCKKILDFLGNEFFEKDYKSYTIVKDITLNGRKWDVVLKADVQKFQPLFVKKKRTFEEQQKFEADNKALFEELNKFAEETSEKFGNFRVKLYSAVIDKTLRLIKEKKPVKVFSFNLNKDNVLHILPSADRVELVYGVNFSQDTDRSLAKVFLQELEEAKRHVVNCLDAKVYTKSDQIPTDILDVDKVDNYSNGLVVFNLYVKDYDQVQKKLNYFVNFRQYIQFHIHSIKTFLHIRMNRKGREIESKLNSCKIIPDDYLKSLDSQDFYIKRGEDGSENVFASSVQKVNV